MSQPESEVVGHDAARPAPPDLSRPNVLLVDDQPARLLTYESILEGVGVNCVRAQSGKEALERLLRQPFAVIVLDVSMPEMDGFETARLIREHPRFEHTPIIFVTGVHVTQLDALRGYEVGAIDYISVPIVPEILRSKVALLVELYKRRTELEALNRDLQITRTRLGAEQHHTEWLTALLNSMNEEVYFTDTQKRYMYANPAALREFGHNSVDGVEVQQLVAGLEVLRPDGTPRPLEEAPPLRALSGEVIRGEEQIVRIPRTGEFRHRQVSSAPVRNASGEIIGSVSVVRDVTEQKRIEAELRARDARSRALLQLGDRFRELREPADLAFAAAQLIGEMLHLSRCGYGTIDPVAETINIERDWTAPGVPSLAGILHFREYGTYIDDLKRGDTVVCADANLDPRTTATADMLARLQVRSFVNMPITEQGGPVALLYLGDPAVRTWTAEELSFVREVAERTRIAVERRRNEQALAIDLHYTRILRDLAARLVAEDDMPVVFDEILAAAMTLARADGGTIQLLDEAGEELVFAATRGLDRALTSQFERVNAGSHTSCGRALARGERVFVDFDVPASEDPDGSARIHFLYGLRSAQSTPLVSRSGRALGMVSTHWQTRRRPDERELRFLDLLARQAADLIERMHAEQALRLGAQQLRDADKRKDEFIAMLAHELRNPLVPIRTGVELLKSARSQPALIDNVRPMMERQTGHMVRLIDDLLDVSRITSGKIELQRQRVTLASVVGSAVEANRAAIAAGNLDLTVTLSEPMRGLEVDPTRFAQVISNLLQNATKFTPSGGRISVRGTLEAVAASTVPQLVLTITDSGVGISEAMLPRVFDLFAQSDGQVNQTGRGQAGLGIGLAIARRLMELHGGSIDARSEGSGRGSEFTIRMPAPHAEVERNDTSARGGRTLTGVCVLVIDDNCDAADVTKMLVEDMGGTARVVYDGAAALTLLETFRPAVILLDIGMPGMDGYETCRRIRQQLGGNVGLVALTGWGQEQDKRQATQAGFDAHLTKPADPARLEAVMRALSRRLV